MESHFVKLNLGVGPGRTRVHVNLSTIAEMQLCQEQGEEVAQVYYIGNTQSLHIFRGELFSDN